MANYNLYTYDSEKNKIKIYSEETQSYLKQFGIEIGSIDFDKNFNIIIYIAQLSKIETQKFEKYILENNTHLNDVEIRNMKMILKFNCKDIEIL